MADYHLGALVRPSDPREEPYRLVNTPVITGAADLQKPRLLSRWQGRDVRVPVGDQGGMGACASWAAAKAVMMAGRIAGRAVEPLAPGPLYEAARRLRGWFPGDTGSYIADNLDLLLDGGPAVIEPYIGSAGYDYNDAAWNGKSARDYEDAHHPFYPTEGSFAARVWLALDAGLPVVFGSYWPGAWFSPQGGTVAPLTSAPPDTGAHAYICWGSVPGYWLCDNQWSEGWSADAAAFGHDMRPGSFAIPWVSEPLVFEARAVALAVVPEPPPPPEPEKWAPPPEGTPERAIWDAGFQYCYCHHVDPANEGCR